MACSLTLGALRRDERTRRSTEGIVRAVRERIDAGVAVVIAMRVVMRVMKVKIYILGGGW